MSNSRATAFVTALILSVYAAFAADAALKAPKPSASDGKYRCRVRVAWKSVPGAVRYKVRRGNSGNYSKSRVIATTKRTSYMDWDAREDAKCYYWIVPVDSRGKRYVGKSRYDAGHVKPVVRIWGAEALCAGDKEEYALVFSCSEAIGKYGWKIVSGGNRATISKSGVLHAKKPGKVVIQAKVLGKSTRLVVTVKEKIWVRDNGDVGWLFKANDFSNCLSRAENDHVPLVAILGTYECQPCKELKGDITSYAKMPVGAIVCLVEYYGSAYDSWEEKAANVPGWDWFTSHGTGHFPKVVFYWNKGNGEVVDERQCWTVDWPEKEHSYHARTSSELFKRANELFMGVRFR